MSGPDRVHGKLSNSEIWGALVGISLGIFVTWSGLKLKIGSINDPGSGFVLFYTGLLMCVFAITILVAAINEGGATLASLWAGARWSKPLTIITCLAAFSLLFEPLGFLLAASPLLLLLLRVIDPVRWTLTIPLSVLAPLGSWWVLKHLLHIQLPAGIFGIG